MMNGAASVTRLRSDQRVVDGAGGSGLPFCADAAGQVALRVDVDEQHAPIGEGERGRQVDGRGGLADAALLVGDGDDRPITYSGVCP